MSLLTSIRITLRSFWKASLLLAILFFGFSALAGWASFSFVPSIISFIFGVIGFFDDSSVKRKLIKQIGNQVPDEAKSAISQLNTEGYLHRNWLFLRDGALARKDFTGVNLSGADLRAINNNVTDLEKVNFTRANLSGANLTKANLKNAILDHTDLENANLTDVQLQKAQFSGTNLCGANLTNANLQGAIFVNVICDGKTVLPNGEKWKSGVNWAVWGVRDETPTYLKDRILKKDDVTTVSPSDLNILTEILRYLGNNRFSYIVSCVQTGNVSYTSYQNTIQKYQDLRDIPEKRFRNPALENLFANFDRNLERFLDQFHSSERFDGSFYVPKYKRDDYAEYGTPKYDRLYDSHETTKNMSSEIVEQFNDLLNELRDIVPDNYNFPS